MYTLPLILKVPMLIAALVCAGISAYSPVLAYKLLKGPSETPAGLAARLMLWLVRKSYRGQPRPDAEQPPGDPATAADLASRCAFLGGALGAIVAAWVVELLSDGAVFPTTMNWTTALRGAAEDVLPWWVMGYVFWRIGHRAAHDATRVGPEAFIRPSRFRLSTAMSASAFCILAGLDFMQGVISVVDFVAYALVKAGLI
jgi:hypothetical protein